MSEVFSRAGVLGIVVAAAGWLAAVMDAAPDAPSGVEQQLQFAARTQGVLVDVEVLRDGHPYPGLAEADFELRDNGVPQAFEMVKTADAPINAVLALDVSAYSLIAISKALSPLMTNGGAIMTLTYLGSTRVVTNYNVMGVAKAALEAEVKYLASELGPSKIRVNAISAGAIKTISARGVKDLSKMLEVSAQRAPLRRNTDIAEVADAAVFLGSDLGRGVTGNVIYVDAGFQIMGL